MEIYLNLAEERPDIKAVIFDFDGTISTLRHGWEKIMEPFMLEMIAGDTPIDEALIRQVREYVDQSTGILTFYQMKWLSDAVKKYGRNPGAPEDPWWYKAEYNERLMKLVEERKEKVSNGVKNIENYLVKGSREFLAELQKRGIEIYVASGTDDPDVKQEAEFLGLNGHFKEVAGAPLGSADCSKEAVLRKLIHENRFKGQEIAVFGDGKVEIELGREVDAITVGVASDEDGLFSVNPVKRKKLVKAGAHAIIGDYGNKEQILNWLGLK